MTERQIAILKFGACCLSSSYIVLKVCYDVPFNETESIGIESFFGIPFSPSLAVTHTFIKEKKDERKGKGRQYNETRIL